MSSIRWIICRESVFTTDSGAAGKDYTAAPIRNDQQSPEVEQCKQHLADDWRRRIRKYESEDIG